MPPFPSSVPHNSHSYKASPLQRTLTPPRLTGPTPFPSVETSNSMSHPYDPINSSASTHSSTQSGQNFHIPSTGLSLSNSMSSDPDNATSPSTFFDNHHNSHAHSHNLSSGSSTAQQQVQIYCAKCRRLSALKDSYACTECISGFCPDCVYALSSEHSQPGGRGMGMGRGRPCPSCGGVGVRFKPFKVELR